MTAKLHFRTPSPVTKALKSAKNLAHHSSRVAVSKDLSYEDREKKRSAVKKLRSKIKEQPELHWVIQGFRVVNLGLRRRKKQTKVDFDTPQSCSSDEEVEMPDFAVFDNFLKSRLHDCAIASGTTTDSDYENHAVLVNNETDNISSRGAGDPPQPRLMLMIMDVWNRSINDKLQHLQADVSDLDCAVVERQFFQKVVDKLVVRSRQSVNCEFK